MLRVVCCFPCLVLVILCLFAFCNRVHSKTAPTEILQYVFELTGSSSCQHDEFSNSLLSPLRVHSVSVRCTLRAAGTPPPKLPGWPLPSGPVRPPEKKSTPAPAAPATSAAPSSSSSSSAPSSAAPSAPSSAAPATGASASSNAVLPRPTLRPPPPPPPLLRPSSSSSQAPVRGAVPRAGPQTVPASRPVAARPSAQPHSAAPMNPAAGAARPPAPGPGAPTVPSRRGGRPRNIIDLVDDADQDRHLIKRRQLSAGSQSAASSQSSASQPNKAALPQQRQQQKQQKATRYVPGFSCRALSLALSRGVLFSRSFAKASAIFPRVDVLPYLRAVPSSPFFLSLYSVFYVPYILRLVPPL